MCVQQLPCCALGERPGILLGTRNSNWCTQSVRVCECVCAHACVVSACVWLNKVEKRAGTRPQQFLEDGGGTGGDPFPKWHYCSFQWDARQHCCLGFKTGNPGVSDGLSKMCRLWPHFLMKETVACTSGIITGQWLKYYCKQFWYPNANQINFLLRLTEISQVFVKIVQPGVNCSLKSK